MSFANFIKTVGKTIAGDDKVNDWCQANFGKDVLVLAGIPPADPPGKELYPLVAIADFRHVRGNAQPDISAPFALGCAVVNEDLLEDGNFSTYAGLLQAEELRELVEEALYNSRELPDLSTDGFPSEDNFHPLWVSYTLVTFSAKRTSRQNMPV
jgi:hypothetical protein